jgi:hypothetical protein
MKAADTESEEFGAKAKVLKDLVLHHAEEEEEPQMFVKAPEGHEQTRAESRGGHHYSRGANGGCNSREDYEWRETPGSLMSTAQAVPRGV